MKILSSGIMDTLKIGRSLAKKLKPGDIVCLFGELGSGKTVLTQGIASGLGIKKERVISPSFVLMREHRRARLPLYHFDLYRLKQGSEILGLGLEEYLYGDGVCVVEWADRLGCLRPREFLKAELVVKSRTQRSIKFTAFGSRWRGLTPLK
jgi:tRNA threonylcarbamoyladenosine biosynthesis protein TsaE